MSSCTDGNEFWFRDGWQYGSGKDGEVFKVSDGDSDLKLRLGYEEARRLTKNVPSMYGVHIQFSERESASMSRPPTIRDHRQSTLQFAFRGVNECLR